MDQELKKIIESSNNIVFFGGAGVSTESGIPDFRSATGLYNQKHQTTYAVEEMLSHAYFMRHCEEFYDYYKNHLLFPEAKPNQAHIALAKLEAAGKLKAVITQNIDGLHQAAGSKNVLELHGSVYRNYCMDCGRKYELEDVLSQNGVPKCGHCGGIIRPDVVLYGESLDQSVIERAVRYIAQAEVLIIGGTSLVVYPAAGLIQYFRGKSLILINQQATPQDDNADLVVHEAIGKVLGEVVE